MKKGYIIYAIDLLGTIEDKICFFSYSKKEEKGYSEGYGEEYTEYLVISCDMVKNKEDIYNSLLKNGYDGEYIEYFLQEDVPYNFN